MINITFSVFLGSPSMKYPKIGFKIMNITQIPKMNPARGSCFIVHCEKIFDQLFSVVDEMLNKNLPHGVNLGRC